MITRSRVWPSSLPQCPTPSIPRSRPSGESGGGRPVKHAGEAFYEGVVLHGPASQDKEEEEPLRVCPGFWPHSSFRPEPWMVLRRRSRFCPSCRRCRRNYLLTTLLLPRQVASCLLTQTSRPNSPPSSPNAFADPPRTAPSRRRFPRPLFCGELLSSAGEAAVRRYRRPAAATPASTCVLDATTNAVVRLGASDHFKPDRS